MSVDYLSALNSKGSGLNITQIVDSIVQAETAPERDSINKKIEVQNTAISDIGTIVSDLDKLKTSVLGFKNKTKLTTSSTSTSATLSISNPSIARQFTSDINITSLATSQTLEISGYSLPTSSTGSGSINIEFGQWLSGASTDNDSLFSKEAVSSGVSLGTPTSHSSLKGTISILSEGGDLSSTVFTVTGTDMAGNTISETITGPTFGNSTSGTKVFKAVTSVVPNSTVANSQVTIGHIAASFGVNSAKTSETLTINSGATLTSVANSLNNLTGVSANIINKGDGTYSLIVKSETGLNNALRLTVTEASGDAGLSSFDNTSNNASLQQTAASDAVLTVDGVTVNRSQNEVDDLFDGYTLSLVSTSSSAFRVKSILDKSSSLTLLKDFVTSVNDARIKLNMLTRVGDANNEEGSLRSNIFIKSVKDSINNMLTGKIIGFSEEELYLSSLGVRTNTDGTLSINENTFNTQIEKNSKVFDAVFNSLFSSTSPFLKIDSASSTRPKPGIYSYVSDFVSKNLTSNATSSSTQTITVSDNSGIEVGDFVIGNGIPSGTTVTNISGTTITISNRLASGSVITSGTEISFKNAKLNGYSMSSVTDSNNISSFVSSATSSNGGGIKVTPKQDIIGAQVMYGQSLVEKLSEYLTNALSTSGTLFKAKENANNSLNNHNLNLTKIDDKVKTLTERYKKQFTAMENIVTSLKSTGEYMENMLNAWNDDD